MSETTTTGFQPDMLAKPGRHIDPVELLTVILRSKRTVLLSGAVVAVLVALFSLRLHPRYTASVEIMPPQISRGGSAAAMLSQSSTLADGGLGNLGSVLQAKNQADTFVAILGAWPVADAVTKRFDLANAYHVKREDQAREMLVARTVINATKEGLILVSVTDADKNRSAALANGYVDALREFMHGLALTEASQRRVFYEGQLAKTKDDLALAEVNFQKMQQASGMIALDSQAKELIDTAAGLRSEITAKEVELEGFRTYSTESNPQVQIAETELSALRSHLAQVESTTNGAFSGGALSKVPGAEIAYVRADRELKYQDSLYQALLKQYEGSRIDEARDAPIVQVIAPALVPDHKSGPHRVFLTLEGFVVGLVLGLAVVLYRSWRSGLDAARTTKWAELRKSALRW
jgi:uncharacterized protein involved in exopolysaccharide biosynthesis